MYEQIFNFNSRPFTSAPFVKHYFASESMHQALVQTRQSIDRAAGPVVVVGEAGTGKSLLLAMLEAQYQHQFSVCNLGCVRLDKRESLLQSILFTLGQPHQGMSEGDLRFALIEFLKPTDRCPNGVLLLIDDAQRLDTGLMDEVKLITNFARDGQPRVRLVLAGTQKLEDNLTDPRLQSLSQRISARCFLSSLTRAETAEYIREHITRVGGDADQIFDAEAMKAVHECSGGCPRLVNQICEHALMIAGTLAPHRVTEDRVREAWNDVQGIPGDWSAPAPTQSNTSQLEGDDSWTVIEFGQLDDDGDEAATAYDFNVQDESPSDPGANVEGETVSLTSAVPTQTIADEIAEPAMNQSADEAEVAKEQLFDDGTPNFAVSAQTASDYSSVMHETQSPYVEDHQSQAIVEEPLNEPIEEPGKKVNLRRKVETIDPFAESFDEEEPLGDRFAPMVVEQNLSSLNVTSDDLQTIKPLDEIEAQGQPEPTAASGPAAAEETSNLVADLQNAIESTAEPVETASMEADLQKALQSAEPQQTSEPKSRKIRGSIPITFSKPEPQSEEPASNLAEQTPGVSSPTLNLNRESEPTPPAPSVVRVTKIQKQPVNEPLNEPSQITAPESVPVASAPSVEKPQERPADIEMRSAAPADVEQEANAILERLRMSQEVSHETVQKPEVEKPVVELPNKDQGLEESQKILAEILEQKNMLAASQAGIDPMETGGSENRESVKLEYPVVSAPQRQPVQDDSEMIVVARTEQQAESSRKAEPELPKFPQTPVSTGKAERMDYQQLFNQLRDITND